MITVHHLNNSRSQRVLWLLEELNLPYEIQHYQRDPQTMLAPDSLKKVHALGKAPVLQDGEMMLAESGAIIDYLATAYGEGELAPSNDPKVYQQYRYWMHFAEGSLMPPMLVKLIFERVKNNAKPFFVKPIAKKIADKVSASYIRPNLERLMGFVDQHLAENRWFCGEDFSAADVQMSFPLEAAVARGSAASYPHIQQFVQRIQSRPGYQVALQKGGDYEFAK